MDDKGKERHSQSSIGKKWVENDSTLGKNPEQHDSTVA